jgi:hypothetical protein
MKTQNSSSVLNSIEIKNRIKKIIRNRVHLQDPESGEYLKQIAHFIYHSPHDIVDSLQIAKYELKSPVLYQRLEDNLAMMIAENIYNAVSSNRSQASGRK